jgi:hypothetical protein
MYHRPTAQALNAQLAKQRTLVDYWSRTFDLDPARVGHVLLLPEKLRHDRHISGAVTWEDVLDAYAMVGPAYWLGVLGISLERYDELASDEPSFRVNPDDLLTGADIVAAHGAGTLLYPWIGRQGGNGKGLAGDIASGSWRGRMYEVRLEPLPGNLNWFPMSEFLQRTAQS